MFSFWHYLMIGGKKPRYHFVLVIQGSWKHDVRLSLQGEDSG